MKTAPPLSYFGGKTRLATRIVGLLPPHLHYVEPFAGSLAVLLAKDPSRMETVNDLDGDLMTFWQVLRDRPDDLMRVCALTPHARAEHVNTFSTADTTDPLERARRVWVRISQGRSGTLKRTGWRYYVNPNASSGMPRYLDAYVERMAIAAERLHHVSLECRPALDLVAKFGAHTAVCMYVDPPYLGATRTSGSYQTEMKSAVEHTKLLEALLPARAAIVLSGYANNLYDTALAHWRRIEIPTITGQGGAQGGARTEVLWINRDDIHAPMTLDFDSAHPHEGT